MTYKFQKLISSALSVSTVIALTGLGTVSTAFAAQLTEATATLTTVTSGSASDHTVAFKNKSTNAIGKVKIEYTRTPSGSGNLPEGLDADSVPADVATKGVIVANGSTDTSNWTLANATNGTLEYTATTAVTPSGVGATWSYQAVNVINNNATNPTTPCDAVSDSDTCFIRITTYQSDLTTVIDTATTTYTVISPISVTATVDPTLTFTVSGVANATTNDANQGGATSVTTTATTVPFGNVTVGTSKIAQQALAVITNANNGYVVYTKFTSADIMTGTYAANNIDGFIGSASDADWPGSGTGPKVWATPIGTAASVNSGWLGVRSNNAGITAGSAASNRYAPAYNGAGSGKEVMRATGPDNGSTSYVTFQIQANAFQPSDTYTGTMVYNVVASY